MSQKVRKDKHEEGQQTFSSESKLSLRSFICVPSASIWASAAADGAPPPLSLAGRRVPAEEEVLGAEPVDGAVVAAAPGAPALLPAASYSPPGKCSSQNFLNHWQNSRLSLINCEIRLSINISSLLHFAFYECSDWDWLVV